MSLSIAVDQALPSSDSVVLDQKVLNTLMSQLIGTDAALQHEVFYTDAIRQLLSTQATELKARSGGWTFHVSRGVVQGVLTGLVMAVVLKDVAGSSLSLAIIPTILPCLFQIERTQLTRRDQEILMQLHRASGSKGKTSEELFSLLPAEIRDNVNRLDLLEFLEAVTRTGHATEVSPGVFELRHPDCPKFSLSIV